MLLGSRTAESTSDHPMVRARSANASTAKEDESQGLAARKPAMAAAAWWGAAAAIAAAAAVAVAAEDGASRDSAGDDAADCLSATSTSASDELPPGAGPFRSRSDPAQTSTVEDEAAIVFPEDEVEVWEPERFRLVRKVQDAKRSHGEVLLMKDERAGGALVAVKRMPTSFLCASLDDFMREHPWESERPWADMGVSSALRDLGAASFPYACRLQGVYRDGEHVYAVSDYANGGDMFGFCADQSLPPPGPEREAVVLPLARQIVDGIRRLHDLSIIHGDVSLENLLLSKREPSPNWAVQIIDFGRATRSRSRTCCVAKPSYRAPEMPSSSLDSDACKESYDGFLADAFAVGVVLYTMLLRDYPWLSTEPGTCKSFDYYRKHGFRALLEKRKIFGSSARASACLSEGATSLLEGLLAANPSERLTLGESVWGDRPCRPSAWQSCWLGSAPGATSSSA